MAVATSNFDAGLVQLAVQSGRVIQYQRNVCPTLALALGKDPIMADNMLICYLVLKIIVLSC